MRESTKVLFPRFQYETEPQKPKYPGDKDLHWRAEELTWLPVEQLEQTQRTAQMNIGARRVDMKGNWWGVSHSGRISICGPEVLETPLTHRECVFTGKVILHDYQWDHQAVSGKTMEVILERLAEDASSREVAAILIDTNPKFREPRTEVMSRQRFVVRHAISGEWMEPVQPLVPRNELYLRALSEMATREPQKQGLLVIA